MNQAQRLFHESIAAAVAPLSAGNMTRTKVSLSARSGMPFPIDIKLERNGSGFAACWGNDFTGAVGCLSADDSAELTASLTHEILPALDGADKLTAVLTGVHPNPDVWVLAAVATCDSPEFRTVNPEVGNILEKSCREAIELVFSGWTNFAQVRFTPSPRRHDDPTWVNVHRLQHEGRTVYLAETNDRCLMVGTPPSFYVTAASAGEMVASVMSFLSERYVASASMSTLIRGGHNGDRIGESVTGEVIDRVIDDLPA